MAQKKVFIIHGRDIDAKNALARFLKALRLGVLEFDAVAEGLGPSPFIADVVFKAVQMADAIIALFTPDEHSALYPPGHPDGTLAEHAEERWQARPNVIFEAGVALGSRPNETLLVTLGADVKLFSDVNGMHFVQLDRPDGKARLWNRLKAILFPQGGEGTNRGNNLGKNTFVGFVQKRWAFYDEVRLLANRLRNHFVGNGRASRNLLDMVKAVVSQEPLLDPMRIQPRGFMQRLERQFPKLADEAYWWLVVFGFFRFNDDENWGLDEESWETSASLAQLPERAVALIYRIQRGL